MSLSSSAVPPAEWLHAPCGLMELDGGGQIVRVNATLCEWLGYRADELAGQRRFSDLLVAGARLFHYTHWAPLLQMQGSISEVQLDMLHRDGRRVPALFNVQRTVQDGLTRDHVALLRVGDRKKYERELLAARRRAEAAEALLREANDELALAHARKDEFLATLAHELRNPLAPIASALQAVKLQPNNADLSARAHAIMARQLAQATRLVDDLLEVSRISQGKLGLACSPCDVQGILQEAIEAVDLSRHVLEVQIPQQPIALWADRSRMIQLVSNLLNNARKFTPRGGRIAVAARDEGDMALVSVQDSGIGIAPEDLEGIFEMFAQTGGRQLHGQAGLGVGLALVRGLVELHGGTVQAFSEGAGRGSRFEIRVPKQSPDACARSDGDFGAVGAGERPLGQGAQPVRALSILIVDDNRDAAETLQLALGLMGHTVHTAHTAADGLARYRESGARCALLDIGLPDMDGYALARRMREAADGRPLALGAVTGWGQERDKQLARAAGFDFHLTKPIDFADLQALLNGVA